MSIFKCKMCGGTIEFEQGATVGVCDSCGTKQTLPKTNDDAVANYFNRANNLRLKCEFDKAAAIYEKIVEQDDGEAEAHWGIVLCKYGIEYVTDPASGKKLPTCHRTLFEAVTADPDYQAAIDYSDAAQQELYVKEARAIDRIQKDILAIVKNEKPFDVFICYKETDANGKRTQDSAIANDIYHQLTQEGFKVFYAAITLEDKLGQEYEPYIFAALNSAKVMLAVGTNPDYFNAVWVKNEWSRYIKLMKTDRNKLLIPCYKGMDAYELPEEFAHLQAQDMGKIGFINDIVRGIKKVVSTGAAKKETQSATAAATAAPGTASLLKRAFMFLEDGDWTSANDYCEKVLDINPECAEAYLGKLMAELKVNSADKLKDVAEPFDGLNNCQKALRFADEKLKRALTDSIAYINERNETERKEGIYRKATSAMGSAASENAYIQAATAFLSIQGWRDADEMAVECQRKIGEIKAKEEADRIERERMAEQERIAAELAAKKRKKVLTIVLPIVAAAIAFLIVLFEVILPTANYNKACAWRDAGQYDEAIVAFEALDGYKDSAEQIIACRYGKACTLRDAGQYNEAIAAFEAMGGYKDSKVQADTCLYLKQKDGLKCASVGATIKFGTYEQDNNTNNGKEEIEWRVLAKEGDKLLLISEYALDAKPYNTEYTDVTWETCSLRKWLNEEFINTAFGAEEQALIQTATVTADKNPDFSTNPGNATEDKIFLLSIEEVNKYFTSDEDRKCVPTEYAVAQGAWTSSDNKKGGAATGWWWLRSPGGSQYSAAGVSDGGSVHDYGDFVNGGLDCVRPALWINPAS